MTPLLISLACHGPEKGIDRTELSGVVVMRPIVHDESSDGDTSEDQPADLGVVTYRHAVGIGTTSSFGVDDNGFPTGDVDAYLFAINDDGTAFDIMLEYPFEPSDTTAKEGTVYGIDIWSADLSTLYTFIFTSTEQGFLTWPVTLGAGEYVANVYGVTSDGSGDEFTFTIGGLDPNTTTILVGAYESGDIENLGNPVAGTSVAEFVLDEEDPHTWVGDFAMPPGLRTATTCIVGTEGCADAKTTKDTGDTGDSGDTGDTGDSGDTGDTGDSGDTADTADTADTGGGDTGGADTADTGVETTHTTVVEGVDEVYIVAGTFANLNAIAIGPGVFYASQILELPTANEKSHTDLEIELDTIVPKPLGWTVNEIEPNEGFDKKGKVDMKLVQMLPPASGGKLVDVINGVQNYGKKHGGNDVDVYGFTVETALDAVFTMSWSTKDPVNNDMYLLDAAGNILLQAWKNGDVNPEFMQTTDKGLTLQPGETYLIYVGSYKGPIGDHPYKIEILYP